MHPKISKFISNTFYGSELDDYEHLMKIIGQPKFYNYYTYSPVVVLHVRGYELFTRNSY
jgi:senataxin